MLKLYHVPGTRSARVVWLCEELGLPLDIEEVSFSPDFRMSAEWLARNPVGKVPVMEDEGLSMFESGAMVQYILDRYGEGRLQPEHGTAAHALFLQWCWFAEATFARPLGEMVNHRRNFRPAIPAILEEMQGRVTLCIAALDKALDGKAFIAGDEFSAADIMLGYCLMLCTRLMPAHDYANVNRYWGALGERPGAIVAFGDISQGPLAGR